MAKLSWQVESQPAWRVLSLNNVAACNSGLAQFRLKPITLIMCQTWAGHPEAPKPIKQHQTAILNPSFAVEKLDETLPTYKPYADVAVGMRRPPGRSLWQETEADNAAQDFKILTWWPQYHTTCRCRWLSVSHLPTRGCQRKAVLSSLYI